MIKATKFVSDLLRLTKMKTKYCNKYPYNIGYVYEDGSRSFDCWNMIKSLLNGYDISITTPGYKSPTLSITGDISGRDLLNKCSIKSKDFSKLSIPGTYLFIADHHSGIYVGDQIINGKTYNVVECTASWDKKVLLSYVDKDGTRRQYKGARKNGAWTDYGLLTKWVDYEGKITPPEIPTLNKPKIPDYYLRNGSRGEEAKKLQYALNYLHYTGLNGKILDVDGVIGQQTVYALRKFQRDKGLVVDGVYGPKTKDKLARAIQ